MEEKLSLTGESPADRTADTSESDPQSDWGVEPADSELPQGEGPLPDAVCSPRFLFVSYLQGSVCALAALALLQLAPGVLPLQLALPGPAILAILVGLINTQLWSKIVFQISGMQRALATSGADTGITGSAQREGGGAARLLLLASLKALLLISVVLLLLSSGAAEILSMLTGFTLFLFFGTFVLAFKSKKMMKASLVAPAAVSPDERVRAES